MTLTRPQYQMMERLAEAQQAFTDLAQAAMANPKLGVNELPDMCLREPCTNPEDLDCVLCELQAWITALARWYNCSGSVNPAQCVQQVCNDYHDEATECEL